MLWPQAQSMKSTAPPMVRFRGHQDRRPSVFMWPISASIALRRRRSAIIAKLALVSQLLHQQPKGADMIYALHEPEVDCISKGRARRGRSRMTRPV